MAASDPDENVEFMNPADIGLVDAVRSGWFGEGKLYDGFPVCPGDRVADIGCGSGWAGPYCAKLGATVTLVDVDESKVRELEARLNAEGKPVSGYVADGTELPFADASFNRIVCTCVLEHVPDPAEVMREIFRIAEPGALILLSVPHPMSEELVSLVAPKSYFRPPNHVRTIQPEELKTLAADAGLELQLHRVYGFFWSLGLAALYAIRMPECEPGTDPSIEAPYPDLLRRWARVWSEMLDNPALEPVRTALDQALPRTQVLIARKPL